jgi:hypothetical protein
MATKKNSKNSTKHAAYKAILANKSYGLYYGEVVTFDAVSGVAVVRGCRHVCQWYGKTGGITSLAAHGLCGPRASESRIGAPCDATLTGIVNVFACSPESAATIDAAAVS